MEHTNEDLLKFLREPRYLVEVAEYFGHGSLTYTEQRLKSLVNSRLVSVGEDDEGRWTYMTISGGE